jgi:plasmid stabilization system protein ParE
MTLHFKETAEADLFEIADKYALSNQKLAEEFAAAVFRKTDLIQDFPLSACRSQNKFDAFLWVNSHII